MEVMIYALARCGKSWNVFSWWLHAMHQLTLLYVRQETSYMRQGESNSGNTFHAYSAASLLKNISYHCGCDRLIGPHPVIQIINLTLKKSFAAPRSPISVSYIYTLQGLRWGKKQKRTYSLRGSYISTISLEHVIYIYALIKLFVSADWPQLVVAHKYLLGKLMQCIIPWCPSCTLHNLKWEVSAHIHIRMNE